MRAGTLGRAAQRSAPSPAELCATEFTLRAKGLSCEASNSLSSPSAEFSGKHLTPARFPARVCFYSLCVGAVEASREQNLPFPTAGFQTLFSRQVSVKRTGSFLHFCTDPGSFYSGWLKSRLNATAKVVFWVWNKLRAKQLNSVCPRVSDEMHRKITSFINSAAIS